MKGHPSSYDSFSSLTSLSPGPGSSPPLGECRGTDGDRGPDTTVSGEAAGQEDESRARLWGVTGGSGGISVAVSPGWTDRQRDRQKEDDSELCHTV